MHSTRPSQSVTKGLNSIVLQEVKGSQVPSKPPWFTAHRLVSQVSSLWLLAPVQGAIQVDIRELACPIPRPAFHKSSICWGHVQESGRPPAPGLRLSIPVLGSKHR